MRTMPTREYTCHVLFNDGHLHTTEVDAFNLNAAQRELDEFLGEMKSEVVSTTIELADPGFAMTMADLDKYVF